MNRANTLAEQDSFAMAISNLLQPLSDTGTNISTPDINHQGQINEASILSPQIPALTIAMQIQHGDKFS